MDYIAKTVKGGDDGGEKGRGTKLQRGGEERVEWERGPWRAVLAFLHFYIVLYFVLL